MRVKPDWWWFLLITGIFIPAGYYLLTKKLFVFGLMQGTGIIGFNPLVSFIFLDFIPVLAITVTFKTLNSLQVDSRIARLVHILAGLVVIVFMLGGFFHWLAPIIGEGRARSYYDYSENMPLVEGRGVSDYYLANFAILIIFLWFYFRNFPKRNNTKKNQ